MKQHYTRAISSRRTFLRLCVTAGIVVGAVERAQATIRGPYSVDANTLQLWHMDGNTTNAVGTGAAVNYLGGSPAPTLNTPSFPGFGSALNVGTTTGVNGAYMGAGAPANVSGPGGSDNINIALLNPTTLAFTFEAIVKLNSLTGTAPMQIMSGEGESPYDYFLDRAFTFGLEPIDYNSGHNVDTDKFRLSFVNEPGPLADRYTIVLPTTGPNAPNTTDFFHVAVTYTGTYAPDCTRFYWTKLDPSATSAALVAQAYGFNLPFDNNTPQRLTNTDFAIGNELRAENGQSQPFNGLIDEVRISGVARTPQQFLFALPATTAYWNADSNGDWTDTTWTGGVSPSGAGVLVSLGGGPTPQTANHTIAVSGTQTVGLLSFTADNGNVISLTQGSAGQISLDNAGAQAQINVYTGSPSIGVPVVLNAQGALMTVSNAADTLTFLDTLDATAGPATLVGPGTVQIGNGTTVGSLAGNVTFNNRLIYSHSNNSALSANLSGIGTFVVNGAGKTTFTGTNSFRTLEVSNGTVTQSHAAGLGPAALIVHSGTVDLNGFNHTANGLSSGAAETTAIVTDNSPGAGTTTLTINQTATNVFACKIQDGSGGKVVALTKAGTGTLTLTNANTFTGPITVLGGTLTINNANGYAGPMTLLGGTLSFPSVPNPFLGGTVGADLQSGAVIFNNSGGTLTGAALQAMFVAGYIQTPKFSSGLFHASVLPPGRVLGWSDRYPNLVVVASTLPGDTNCDLVVNFDDLLSLAMNYGSTSGAIWYNGDSNYDGDVDFDDLLAVAQNYGQTVTGSFASDWALAQSLAPEPTVLATTLGVSSLFARRRFRR